MNENSEKKIRILITDDQTILRGGIQALLEDERDIEIIGTAENGRKAVDLSLELEPDVILMDIAMPEMNGIEATRRIKQKPNNIKILILSSYDDLDSIFTALSVGAAGFLLKTNDAKELVRAIRQVNAGQTYFDPSISQTILNDYIKRVKITSNEDAYDVLSEREREVFQLLVEGHPVSKIATMLNISVKTVESHRQRVKEVLNLSNLSEMIKYALKKSIIRF